MSTEGWNVSPGIAANENPDNEATLDTYIVVNHVLPPLSPHDIFSTD